MEETQPTGDADKDVFDFFALPRELRNMVYPLLVEDHILNEHLATTEARILHVPLPELQTLSHQFRDEYNETFKQGLTINFEDYRAEGYWPEIPPPPQNITKAKFILLMICDSSNCAHHVCQAEEDTAHHLEWITEIIPNMKDLKSVEVTVYAHWYEAPPDGNATHGLLSSRSKFDTLIECTATERIEVFPFVNVDQESKPEEARLAYEAEQEPAVVWTRKDGWQ